MRLITASSSARMVQWVVMPESVRYSRRRMPARFIASTNGAVTTMASAPVRTAVRTPSASSASHSTLPAHASQAKKCSSASCASAAGSSPSQ